MGIIELILAVWILRVTHGYQRYRIYSTPYGSSSISNCTKQDRCSLAGVEDFLSRIRYEDGWIEWDVGDGTYDITDMTLFHPFDEIRVTCENKTEKCTFLDVGSTTTEPFIKCYGSRCASEIIGMKFESMKRPIFDGAWHVVHFNKVVVDGSTTSVIEVDNCMYLNMFTVSFRNVVQGLLVRSTDITFEMNAYTISFVQDDHSFVHTAPLLDVTGKLLTIKYSFSTSKALKLANGVPHVRFQGTEVNITMLSSHFSDIDGAAGGVVIIGSQYVNLDMYGNIFDRFSSSSSCLLCIKANMVDIELTNTNFTNAKMIQGVNVIKVESPTLNYRSTGNFLESISGGGGLLLMGGRVVQPEGKPFEDSLQFISRGDFILNNFGTFSGVRVQNFMWVRMKYVNLQFRNNRNFPIFIDSVELSTDKKDQEDIELTLIDSVFDSNSAVSTSAYSSCIAICPHGEESQQVGFFDITVNLRLSSCEFRSNRNYMGEGGGAIYLKENATSLPIALEMDKVEMWDNKAIQGHGGAIYFSAHTFKLNSNLLIRNSILAQNVAGGGGGAVFVRASSPSGAGRAENFLIYLKDQTFVKDNEAKYGGGLLVCGDRDREIEISQVNVSESVLVSGNTAVGGGGIYSGGSGMMKISGGSISSYIKGNIGGDIQGSPRLFDLKGEGKCSCVSHGKVSKSSSRVDYECNLRPLQFYDQWNTMLSVPSFDNYLLQVTIGNEYYRHAVSTAQVHGVAFNFTHAREPGTMVVVLQGEVAGSIQLYDIKRELEIDFETWWMDEHDKNKAHNTWLIWEGIMIGLSFGVVAVCYCFVVCLGIVLGGAFAANLLWRGFADARMRASRKERLNRSFSTDHLRDGAGRTLASLSLDEHSIPADQVISLGSLKNMQNKPDPRGPATIGRDVVMKVLDDDGKSLDEKALEKRNGESDERKKRKKKREEREEKQEEEEKEEEKEEEEERKEEDSLDDERMKNQTSSLSGGARKKKKSFPRVGGLVKRLVSPKSKKNSVFVDAFGGENVSPRAAERKKREVGLLDSYFDEIENDDRLELDEMKSPDVTTSGKNTTYAFVEEVKNSDSLDLNGE